jgi:hypothetical protein
VLPKEISDQIIDRTDGVPLFIEELTKTVVESGIVAEAVGHYAVARPMAPMAIPTSLHASLLARLDRLAPTRELAQIGARSGPLARMKKNRANHHRGRCRQSRRPSSCRSGPPQWRQDNHTAP